MTDQITTPRALLEQALEALELVTDDYDDSAVGLEIDAIQALRAALAAPASKPLFAELIAQHEGLAEELAAMDAPPAWHDAPEVAELKAQRDELLAALKDMYSEAIRLRCSVHQKWLQIMNVARAAIAKTEG